MDVTSFLEEEEEEEEDICVVHPFLDVLSR